MVRILAVAREDSGEMDVAGKNMGVIFSEAASVGNFDLCTVPILTEE
jgi:hypothetical protein